MSDEHRLPPGVPAGGPDIGDDAAAAEARGLALLEQTGAAIVEGVEREAVGWVVRAVTGIIDAWGRLDGTARGHALEDARGAGVRARDRVVTELRALFAADPLEQRATPLEIARGLRREPTELLAALGIPEVERDPFAMRAFPDDRYGLTIETLGDLGDPDLAPLLLAWGVGKATVLRARGDRTA